MRKTATALIFCCLACSLARADESWQAFDPSEKEDWPIDYSDAEPQDCGYPFEIFGGELIWRISGSTNASSAFDFKIMTNFGDKAHRASWTGSVYDIDDLQDSYNSGPELVNFAAGDLYILVTDNLDGQVRLFAFVLESRDPAVAEPWKAGLESAGLAYATVMAGQLYEVDLFCA